MLGNPPWLRVEWQEAGVLGDFEPEFVLRKLSASKLATLRIDTFNQIPALEEARRSEYEGCEGMQNFLNAQQNYAVLAGQKRICINVSFLRRGVWERVKVWQGSYTLKGFMMTRKAGNCARRCIRG